MKFVDETYSNAETLADDLRAEGIDNLTIKTMIIADLEHAIAMVKRDFPAL